MSEPHYNWNGGGFCSVCVVDDGSGHVGSAPWPCEVVRARATLLAELRAKVKGSDLPLGVDLGYSRGYSAALSAVITLIDEEKP